MKRNKNRLYYFIILVMVTSLAGVFSFQEVLAKDCELTLNRTCNFSAGALFTAKKCRNIKASRVYDLSDANSSGENNIKYGFCYYDPDKDGFFYEVVLNEKKCTGTQAFIYVGSKNDDVTDLDEKIIIRVGDRKLNKEDGCASYVYRSNANGGYIFSYDQDDKLINMLQNDQIEAVANGNLDASEEKGVTSGNTSEVDDGILEKITTCVENGIKGGKNCNDDGTLKDLKSLQSECVQKYVINFSDSLYNKYDAEINNYYKEHNVAENSVLICRLTKKCNAKPLEIINYIGAKSKNETLSLETLIKESFSSEVQNCVSEELHTNADEINEETENTESDLQNGTDSGLSSSKQNRDDNNEHLLKILKMGYVVEVEPGDGCDAILSDDTTKLFNTVLRYMQYLGPVLVVVLSTMDFIKAAASGNPDDMKKAWNKLVKRLIAAILLFFVALITRLLLSFFDITVPENCIK